MNYRLVLRFPGCAILRTGAAVSNEPGEGQVVATLTEARREVASYTDDLIDELRKRRDAVLRMRERDLPIEGSDATNAGPVIAEQIFADPGTCAVAGADTEPRCPKCSMPSCRLQDDNRCWNCGAVYYATTAPDTDESGADQNAERPEPEQPPPIPALLDRRGKA